MASVFSKRKVRAARSHYRKRGAAPLRLCVCRKSANFYAQLIDDSAGHTVYSVSTLDKGLRNGVARLNSKIILSLGEVFMKNLPVKYKSSKVVFDAGRNLPDKEFRYLRTVSITAAVHRGFDSELLTPPVNLPAPGRRQTLYIHLRVSRVLCF